MGEDRVGVGIELEAVRLQAFLVDEDLHHDLRSVFLDEVDGPADGILVLLEVARTDAHGVVQQQWCARGGSYAPDGPT